MRDLRRDLRRDWQKWTRAERLGLVLIFAAAISLIVPAAIVFSRQAPVPADRPAFTLIR